MNKQNLKGKEGQQSTNEDKVPDYELIPLKQAVETGCLPFKCSVSTLRRWRWEDQKASMYGLIVKVGGRLYINRVIARDIAAEACEEAKRARK